VGFTLPTSLGPLYPSSPQCEWHVCASILTSRRLRRPPRRTPVGRRVRSRDSRDLCTPVAMKLSKDGLNRTQYETRLHRSRIPAESVAGSSPLAHTGCCWRVPLSSHFERLRTIQIQRHFSR
jgi:hypothetical protein